MKYTQKDVCRLLNITRETLRFYEKEGILKPEIDPKNQYRYYDDYQVYLVAESKRYQANEFSIGEIREMITSDSLAQYTARMEQKQEYFERRAQEYFWKEEYNRDYLMKLKLIPELLNTSWIGFHEAVVFFPERKGNLLNLETENISANHFIMNHLEYTFMMAYFPDMNSDEHEWGFGIRRWLCDQLQFDVKNYAVIPSSQAAVSVVDAGDCRHPGISLCEPLKQYAEEQGYRPGGIFCLRQLVRTNEADGMHQYYEAFLPVENNK